MQHHKLDFRNKSHLEQIIIGERLIASAEALTAERRQNLRLEELRAHTASARASHERIAALRSDLKAEITSRKAHLAGVRTVAANVAAGIALNLGYQPAEILAAGLELAQTAKTRVGKPDAPTNLRAVPTDSDGEALLRWRRPLLRCSFEVQWHADPPEAGHWHHEDSCFKQKYLAKGLVSGAKYWFRVRASNAHGPGPWCDIASVRVK
jgi:Fibronectin type III domain